MTRTVLLTSALLVLAACSGENSFTPPPSAPGSSTAESATTESATPESATPGSEIDAVTREAFVAYEAIWQLTRAAFEDPSDATIREQLAAMYAVGTGDDLLERIERQAAEGSIALPPEDGLQQVVIVQSLIDAPEGFAVFQTCETLSATIVDAATGDPTYVGVDSALKEVQMAREGDSWLLFRSTTVEQFKGSTCDS